MKHIIKMNNENLKNPCIIFDNYELKKFLKLEKKKITLTEKYSKLNEYKNITIYKKINVKIKKFVHYS
jgi:hypothetical protein